jgi:hypothetical protein
MADDRAADQRDVRRRPMPIGWTRVETGEGATETGASAAASYDEGKFCTGKQNDIDGRGGKYKGCYFESDRTHARVLYHGRDEAAVRAIAAAIGGESPLILYEPNEH